MQNIAQLICDVVFGPTSRRDPRSQEYKQGALAGLKNAQDAKNTDFQLIKNPYTQGTAASDAWYAGRDEGQLLWRRNCCEVAS